MDRENKLWPDYYTAERTLDIELPFCDLTARVWFDARNDHWTDEKLVELAATVRRNESWRKQPPSNLLDWLASFPGVNAVQIIRSLIGCKIGVMAYTVAFDEAENFELSFTDEEMQRLTEEIASRMHGIPKHQLILPGRQD
jgi:hypothetical protein